MNDPRSGNRESAGQRPRVIGIMVTYQRQALLQDTLRRIAEQTYQLDQILIVDNENSPATRQLIRELEPTLTTPLRYVATAENSGSAGGWAFGMELLSDDDSYDWIMPLDDDDPPENHRDFERMVAFANLAKTEVPNLGAVGIVGARFDWRKGLIRRLSDSEISGRVSVDFVGSGNIPLYHRSAIEKVGVFDAALFFGYTEVEYGLRIKRAGFEVVANAEMWRERRIAKGRVGVQPKPQKVCVVSPRKYYVIRNHIYIMRLHRRWDLAVKQAVIQCVLKPIYTLFISPRLAFMGAVQAWAASTDGFLGRMGKKGEPATRDRERDVFDSLVLENASSSDELAAKS